MRSRELRAPGVLHAHEEHLGAFGAVKIGVSKRGETVGRKACGLR